MARVKSTSSRRHRKVLKMAKGFRDSRQKHYKVAKESVMHAGQYAYEGRKNKKRDIKKLWIIRINAALRQYELKYSKFISSLKSKKIDLDRKILSDIAAKNPQVFKKLVDLVK